MSEEKLYAIKNDEGKYWDFDNAGFWRREIPGCYATTIKEQAEIVADERGGHVVTLIEEPEKIVLTKEQAKIVEGARDATYPATYIFERTPSYDEELIMNAYGNSYTVAKEKKYLVELDGLVTTDGAKQCLTKKDGKWFASRRISGLHQYFTDEELNEAPEWAQQLNREEVTDDEQ